MSDQDIFNDDGTKKETESETQTNSQNDPFADQLSTIVNEDGKPKYDSVDKALAALKESQQFIGTLKQEKQTVEATLAEKEAELAKMGNIDDFVNKLKPDTQKIDPNATQKDSNTLSEEKVMQLLAKSLEQRDAESTASKNLSGVVKTLQDKHGDKAGAFIKQRAVELNTTVGTLEEMAKQNPTLAMSLLGGSKTDTTTASSLQHQNNNPKVDNVQIEKKQTGIGRGGLSHKELLGRWQSSAAETNKRIGLET